MIFVNKPNGLGPKKLKTFLLSFMVFPLYINVEHKKRKNMKRNIKDIQWKTEGHKFYNMGYKRHKMKTFHTNEEARAIDKYYNHFGHDFGDPIVDWKRIKQSLRKFNGKDMDEFRSYVNARTREARNKGWTMNGSVVENPFEWASLAWDENGVLNSKKYCDNEPRNPIVKIYDGKKVFEYRFKPALLNDCPWIFDVIEHAGAPRGIIRKLSVGLTINEDEFNKLENETRYVWKEKVKNAGLLHGFVLTNGMRKKYGIRIDPIYHIARRNYFEPPEDQHKFRELRELLEEIDVTDYKVFERGTKDFKRYYAELDKKRSKERRALLKSYKDMNKVWDKDLTEHNKRKEIERIESDDYSYTQPGPCLW